MSLSRGKPFLFYLLLCTCKIGSPMITREGPQYPQDFKDITSLIYNGKQSSIKKFPWLAQLLILRKEGEVSCGGVILATRIVVTAAHCIVNLRTRKTLKPNKIKVFVGSSFVLQGTEYKVCRVKKHPLFQVERFYFHDIGLIYVTEPIEYGRRVDRAKVARTDEWKNPNIKLIVAGYGATSNDDEDSEEHDEDYPDGQRIRETDMRYVDPDICSKSPNSIGKGKMPVAEHMFCMVGKRTSDCFGDSGSGVMWGEYVIGLVSVGRVKECGSTVPSMYVDLNYFRKWIKESAHDFYEQECTD